MALAARVKCMKITSKKSIDVKVGSYLKALKNKKNWGSDNYICVRLADGTEGEDKVMRYTAVEIVTYSGDSSFMSGEAIIYFQYIVMGDIRQLVFYEDMMDYSSVINLEDAKAILVKKIQDMFEQYVFEKVKD